MSPLILRRYRAERLLRAEFTAMRSKVLTVVRSRLRARGVSIDPADLEACYAVAWQGLYAAMVEGQEIDNPAGWLVLVTFRRALDEHRARRHEDHAPATVGAHEEGASEHDIAGELDDRRKLRHVFEGLRARLNDRECEAASLCYLQGLSRAEAAARMGLSEARMRKLMEGTGRGAPGVAGKVGELLETIRGGAWCEQQASLMRGFAFGILDPTGERYQLALLHQSDCPACRSYVLSLRGLAAILPPVFLPFGLGSGAVAAVGAGAGAGAGAGSTAGASGAAGAGAGTGFGAASGAAVAGVGSATGGSWLLAGGSLGMKLAAGCVLALSVGAGCVSLVTAPHHTSKRAHAHAAARVQPLPAVPFRATQAVGAEALDATGSGVSRDVAGSSATGAEPAAAPLQAPREFGPEHTLASARAAGHGGAAAQTASTRRAAAARELSSATQSSLGGSNTGSRSTGATHAVHGGSSSATSSGAAKTPAAREFGIG